MPKSERKQIGEALEKKPPRPVRSQIAKTEQQVLHASSSQSLQQTPRGKAEGTRKYLRMLFLVMRFYLQHPDATAEFTDDLILFSLTNEVYISRTSTTGH